MTGSTLNKDEKVISSMFDSIAPKYDLLNHLLSFQIDRSWRKKLIATVCSVNTKYVLDMACGTADVTIGLHKKGMEVIGMDISAKMLEIARNKCQKDFGNAPVPPITFIAGSSDKIPFPNSTFDAVTISFGIRNFDHREECIRELYRVLKPSGTLAILEFTIPTKNPLKSLYSFYFKKVLPMIGKHVSKQKTAYEYLPLSAFEFPQREAFCQELLKGNFTGVGYQSLSGGIACIYTGTK